MFSSDDEPDEEKDSFIPINRELEYLKQSSLNYLKHHKLDLILQRINHHDTWTDYTEQLLQKKDAQSQKQQQKRSKRRRKRVSGGSKSKDVCRNVHKNGKNIKRI